METPVTLSSVSTVSPSTHHMSVWAWLGVILLIGLVIFGIIFLLRGNIFGPVYLCEPPTGLTATPMSAAGNPTVRLNWLPVSNAIGYNIYYNNAPANSAPNKTSHQARSFTTATHIDLPYNPGTPFSAVVTTRGLSCHESIESNVVTI
jgi:hypothetical protein